MSRAFSVHSFAMNARIVPYTDNLQVLQKKNVLLKNMTVDTLTHFKGIEPKIGSLRPGTSLTRAVTAATPLTKLV